MHATATAVHVTWSAHVYTLYEADLASARTHYAGNGEQAQDAFFPISYMKSRDEASRGRLIARVVQDDKFMKAFATLENSEKNRHEFLQTLPSVASALSVILKGVCHKSVLYLRNEFLYMSRAAPWLNRHTCTVD